MVLSPTILYMLALLYNFCFAWWSMASVNKKSQNRNTLFENNLNDSDAITLQYSSFIIMA